MPLTVSKNPEVMIHAKAAVDGEELSTVVDGQVVTRNIARQGDMKVTRVDGDSYYLDKCFNDLYHPVEGDLYKPTARSLKAVKVAKHVSFLANWGTRQHIPAGGYIVQDSHGETWGVHQKSFEATYHVKK